MLNTSVNLAVLLILLQTGAIRARSASSCTRRTILTLNLGLRLRLTQD